MRRLVIQSPDWVCLVVSFQRGAFGSQTSTAGLSQYREVAGCQGPLKLPICHSVTYSVWPAPFQRHMWWLYEVWSVNQGSLIHGLAFFSSLSRMRPRLTAFPVSQTEGLSCSVYCIFWSHFSLTVVHTTLTIHHVTNTVCDYMCTLYIRSLVLIGVPFVVFFFHWQGSIAFQTVSTSKNLSHLLI